MLVLGLVSAVSESLDAFFAISPADVVCLDDALFWRALEVRVFSRSVGGDTASTAVASPFSGSLDQT